MKCVKCGRRSSYSTRRRNQGLCPYCREPFAFEPEQGDPLTDEQVANAIGRVSVRGIGGFDLGELWREVEKERAPPSASVGWRARLSKLLVHRIVFGSVLLGAAFYGLDLGCRDFGWPRMSVVPIALAFIFVGRLRRRRWDLFGAAGFCGIIALWLPRAVGFELEWWYVGLPGLALAGLYLLVNAEASPKKGTALAKPGASGLPELKRDDFEAKYLRRWQRAHGPIEGLVQSEASPEIPGGATEVTAALEVRPSAGVEVPLVTVSSPSALPAVEGCSVSNVGGSPVLIAVGQGEELSVGRILGFVVVFLIPFSISVAVWSMGAGWCTLAFGLVWSGGAAVSFAGVKPSGGRTDLATQLAQLARLGRLGWPAVLSVVLLFVLTLGSFALLWSWVGGWPLIPFGIFAAVTLTLALAKALMGSDPRVQVTISRGGGVVLEGVGKLSVVHRFNVAEVRDVRLIGAVWTEEPPRVRIDADRTIELGGFLNGDQRTWMLRALRKHLSLTV